MARQFSLRDLELLGYRDPVTLSDTPGWIHARAFAEGGLERIQAEFIYLKSGCTSEQLQLASRSLSIGSRAYVLVPPSHKLTEASLRSAFGAQAIDVADIEAVVWRKLSSIFAKYLVELQQRIPEERYFVKPRREREAHAQLDKEILDYLAGRGDIAPGTLAVIAAAAGVGKTTLARRTTLDLLRQAKDIRAIPVFVEAAHWDKFNLEADLDLWDIIRNSIDQFGGNVGFTQELFSYALQQGYFVFVFDGFDELCSPKHSQFSPIDVLRFLSDLAIQTEARILITTRTLFWKNEIESIGVPKNVSVVTLAPFNKAQAMGYFQERFKSDLKKRDQANTLYTKLVSRSDLPENEEGGARAKFANLPLVVVMLAEYVDRGGVNFDSQGQLIETLLCRLCLRDQARQDLLSTAKEQLDAFEQVAVNWYEPVNPEFDLETLELVGFPKQDIKDIRHHALVSHGRTANAYRFRWDFLAPYMRALFLRRVIKDRTSDAVARARQIMELEANGKGFVFEHLCGLFRPSDLEFVARAYRETPASAADTRSFLLHLMLALMDGDKVSFTSAKDRITELIRLISPKSQQSRVLSGISVVGQLERLDFRGVTFHACEFRDCALVSCETDETTIFDQCIFVGTLDLTPQASWIAVQLRENCILRSPANLTWNSVLTNSVGDSDDLLFDAFRLGLGKFWHNGSPKDSLKRDDWKRGLLGRTKYSVLVLEALIKFGVILESEKGQYSESRLFFSKDSFGDLQRFMDNRQLTGRIAAAFHFASQ